MTQVTQKTTASNATTLPATPVMRILKIATCPSVSGKSILKYHVGCNDKSEIYLRVHSNSSSGYFSREWIAMSAIQEVFVNVPADKGITSFLLSSLYQGKSQNNYGFLFAALVSEGLAEPVPEQRYYRCTDGKKFAAEITALINSDTNLKVDEPVVKATGQLSATEPKSETPASTPAPSPTGKKETKVTSKASNKF